MIKFIDAVNKAGVILTDCTNLIPEQNKDVQLALLHHHIQFPPDQSKSVQAYEPTRLCFQLTFLPSVKVKAKAIESGIKW